MSSVVSFDKCPICKEEEALYVDFNVRTQEEWCFCNACGFKHEYCYPRDDNGDVIQPAKKIETESFGGGIINIKLLGNVGTHMITMPRYSTRADIMNRMEEINNTSVIEEMYATWFNEEDGKIEHIVYC